MATELEEVQRQVAIGNRVLSALGLATGVRASLGHASMRLPSDPNKFVVKGRGYHSDVLAAMRPQDMVLCDLEGFKIGGSPELYQCHEVKIHSCIFKLRPDVQSVVHVHPTHTILMSVLKQRVYPMCQEGLSMLRHVLPFYPRTKIITADEEGMELARMLGNAKAILMLGHGAVTAGSSLADSVQSMLQLEEQARMNYLAYSVAGPDYPHIPDELVADAIGWENNLPSLPHFKDLPADWSPRSSAVYDYYAEQVSRDL